MRTLSKYRSPYSWRYYRLWNTGMQSDYNYALWIAPDCDPYISGYDPFFGEGGFTKFIQGENHRVNYSNVDYPAIGHPNKDGCMVVWDIVPDATGKLWMGTGRGALRFDPSIGRGALTRFNSENSLLIIRLAAQPKAGGGYYVWSADRYFGYVFRFDSATGAWTYWLPQSQGEIAGMPGQDCVDDAGNF